MMCAVPGSYNVSGVNNFEWESHLESGAATSLRSHSLSFFPLTAILLIAKHTRYSHHIGAPVRRVALKRSSLIGSEG